MTWIYSLPAGIFLFLMVVTLTGVATAGLFIFQRFFPQNDEITHNDVAGPIIGTVGTILAVVLSFMLVINWQNYDSAASTVEQEASAVADLYHAAQSFPPPVRESVQAELRTYIDAVVDQEWPLMRKGQTSPQARSAILAAQRIVENYEPKTASQTSLQQAALTMAGTIEDQRRQRLFANEQGIPVFMWICNLALAAITIFLAYLFRVRSRFAHVLMTASIAVVIAIICGLTAVLDYPFRGNTQIPPDLFVSLQHQFSTNLTGSD